MLKKRSEEFSGKKKRRVTGGTLPVLNGYEATPVAGAD